MPLLDLPMLQSSSSFRSLQIHLPFSSASLQKGVESLASFRSYALHAITVGSELQSDYGFAKGLPYTAEISLSERIAPVIYCSRISVEAKTQHDLK